MNEIEIIPNPDLTPNAVSTGYQLQNTLLEAQRNGLDLSYVSPVVGQAQVTVNISGAIDFNGLLYKCETALQLTVLVGTWYIKLVAGSTVNNVTPELTDIDPIFNISKNGFYSSIGELYLDIALLSNGTNNVQIFKRLKNENGILLDTINEKTSGAGVTIDGVLCKDSEVTTDKVNEKTSGAGITIDGVLCKDNKVRAIGLFHSFIREAGYVFGDELFDAMSPYLLNTNDMIRVTGSLALIGSPNEEVKISFAKRKSSNIITLYGFAHLSNVIVEIDNQNGIDDEKIYLVSIAW